MNITKVIHINHYFALFLILMVSISFCIPYNSIVSGQDLKFKDITLKAGFAYIHGYNFSTYKLCEEILAGGVASGDYDGDGWVDLYVVRGDIGPNLLFKNNGDGTFKEVGREAGVALTGTAGTGPIFADFDGDGWLDLFVGRVNRIFYIFRDLIPIFNEMSKQPYYKVFRNKGDGSFEDVTLSSGLNIIDRPTFSTSLGDYDLDGDLDLFVTHWSYFGDNHFLWKNNGDGTFADASEESGISNIINLSSTFTPNFADINDDSWPDLLIASDFGTSLVLLNQGDGMFDDVTSPVISDENGMGAAVADYDNDGDLDWFVSSISDPDEIPNGNWGVTGNRLYNNIGNGLFDDVTDIAGVREGFWGWGSCFVDFNNDGNLDLFHVNGFLPRNPSEIKAAEFFVDPSRLFISNGDGTFTEKSEEIGLVDNGQGRGVVCFDYDHDGDIDIFIANNSQGPRLFLNEGGNKLNFLSVKLIGITPNTEAIGAKISLMAGGTTQMRHLHAGSNYVSQNPVEAHFGLNNIEKVDELLIVWPDGEITSLNDLPVNQFITIKHPDIF